MASKQLQKCQKDCQYARGLIEASMDPLIVIDTEGKITDVNNAMENLTGLLRNKLIGTDFMNYFTDPQKAGDACREIFAKGFVVNYPLSIQDDTLIHVMFNGSVYKDRKGMVLGAVITARDITAQKRIEDTLNDRLKEISDFKYALDEASIVTITDQNGIIKYTNDAFCRISKYSRSELIGQDHRILNSGYHPKEFIRNLWLTIGRGKIWRGEIKNKDKEGIIYWIDTTIVPFLDVHGKPYQYVAIMNVITEKKRIEQELIDAKEFAEHAVEIAKEEKSKAEMATKTAEVALKAKQQFLSNMSHEIRTPMNSIIGFTKVLLKTELSLKQKEYLGAIKMSGDALIILINDILDLAKVDAGKMIFDKEPFNMPLSISNMLHLFEIKMQEKNLELVFDYDNKIPEILVGDRVRLHQIILNLVSNAVKFTAKGKILVTVRLLYEDTKSATVEFSVMDTGTGIPENEMEKIFDYFQQGSARTVRLHGGTGLGLAIVKQLVESQGGTIHVKSKINEGSVFSFVLRFYKTTEVVASEVEMIDPDVKFKNLKVLVVEDMPLNQLLMKTILDEFGFECDMAGNGKIGVEKLQNKSYDIVLMDLHMPEMNGFEATEYIRNKMNSHIPIIAFTADVTTVDVAKCKASGMNDYIAKPIDDKLLYSKIIGLVKKPVIKKYNGDMSINNGSVNKFKYINLDYLMLQTKSNPALITQIISLYLEQTPLLIRMLKQSLLDKDWKSLHTAAHKMIPSFSIMGINPEFEKMTKNIQEYAINLQPETGINDLVLQIENICTLACKELEEELDRIKNTRL